MNGIDVQDLAARLEHIESIALLPIVGSTNLLARRVITECLENEVALPSAAIVALEQTGGQGRESRAWHSPPGRGIWSTILHTRLLTELSLLPLELASAIARFLRDQYRIDAHIKWPNDVLVEGRKIAGTLIEARSREDQAFLAIGIGLNVLPLGKGAPPEAISIAEATSSIVDLPSAIQGFLGAMDEALFRAFDRDSILAEWRALTMHRDGDRVGFVLHGEKIEGTWRGIDENGHARIEVEGNQRLVSAGDLILLDQG
jgi:BirA family transcriptional regulator, biotin operon repressor / biotin---[acetyl-CoA-carboxylase] ligase